MCVPSEWSGENERTGDSRTETPKTHKEIIGKDEVLRTMDTTMFSMSVAFEGHRNVGLCYKGRGKNTIRRVLSSFRVR